MARRRTVQTVATAVGIAPQPQATVFAPIQPGNGSISLPICTQQLLRILPQLPLVLPVGARR